MNEPNCGSYFIMDEQAKATLSYLMNDTEVIDARKEGTLTTYCQVVSHLLVTYATNKGIAEAKADIMIYKHIKNVSTVCRWEIRWEKVHNGDESTMSLDSMLSSKKDYTTQAPSL